MSSYAGDVVWQYWEGPCPDYIAMCMETVRAHHGPNYRLLDPASFDALRIHDRDLDLSAHRPTQRSNFVRAYLLAHYGGCWVDSDFLCFRPLYPLWRHAGMKNFAVYHGAFNGRPQIPIYDHLRGIFDSDFLWAAPGSFVAGEFYQRMLAAHRAKPPGEPMKWAENGAVILTPLVREHMDQVLIVPTEAVSPFRMMAVACALEAFDDDLVVTWQPPPTCYGIQLVNSAIGDDLRKWSRADIITSRSLLGTWMRAAWMRAGL